MLEMDGKMGFFVWAYFPQEMHTPENIKQFQRRLYLRSACVSLDNLENESSGFTTNREHFQQGRILNFYAPFVLNEPGELNASRWTGPFDLTKMEHKRVADQVDHQSYFDFCAGMPGGKESYPKYQRPGCISICYFTHKEDYDPENPRQQKPVFYILREFATVFDIVFAFGHYQYNKWVRTHETMPAPERRIWPFNIFNLRMYDEVLLTRLGTYSKENPSWNLELVGDHIAFFHLKDLTTQESKVPPSTTEAILGSGDNILLPRGQTGI